jgi:tetratricopeptide (TPR) repeat protein
LNHIIEGSFLSLELIYEHRNYLPSMLLFVPLSVGLIRGLEFFSKRKAIFYFLAAAITIIIIIESVTVYLQNDIMRNEISLWSDNVEKSPRLHHPHQSLAVALLISGHLPESLKELKLALESFESGNITKKSLTYGCLGEYYFVTGDDQKALDYFNKSIFGYPPSPYMALSFDRIAIILMKKGDLEKAEKTVLKAISLKPYEAGYFQTYSAILNKKKQPDAAIKQAQKAIKLNPDSFWSYRHIADAFKIKKNKNAEQHFRAISNALMVKYH